MTNKPTRKVSAGALGGAAAILLSWVLTAVTGAEPPAPVVAAFTTLLTIGASFLTPEA